MMDNEKEEVKRARAAFPVSWGLAPLLKGFMLKNVLSFQVELR